MPSMPTYHVSKGSQFGLLDGVLGGSDFLTQYTAALGRLQGTNPIPVLDAAAAARVAPNQLSSDDFNHFTQHWLGDWWGQRAVPDTLRAGFTQAITHAQTVQKPIEALWVCALDQAFHVYYCEGPRQVTVIIFTPPPPRHTTLPLAHPEDIWVVKLRDQFDDQYPSKGPGIQPPAPVATVQSGPAQGQDIIKQRLHHA
jgi:hypothetical protein